MISKGRIGKRLHFRVYLLHVTLSVKIFADFVVMVICVVFLHKATLVCYLLDYVVPKAHCFDNIEHIFLTVHKTGLPVINNLYFIC